jgi:peroxiredoxin
MPIVSATATDASRDRDSGRGRDARLARTGRAAWVAGVALALFASAAAAAEPGRALIGQPAPDFTERSMTGGNLRLSEHRGDVVLVGFWTSWCGTCRAYLEHLARLHATYGSAGLVIVGVSLDDDARRASSLLRAVDARFPNVFDARKQLGPEWRVGDVPMTVLIDRAGVVRHVHGELSRRDEPQLVEEIRRLLDE